MLYLDANLFTESLIASLSYCRLVLFFSHRSLNRLKDLVAEHLDHLHFLNDILCLQIDALNAVLTDHLLNRLFIPLYIYSIGAPNRSVNVAQADEVSNSTSSTSKLQVQYVCSSSIATC